MTATDRFDTNPVDAAREVPSLSVVIPSFNAGHWLLQTLDHLRTAIERAEWPDVEVLVVDDGSTDGSAEGAVQTAVGASVRLLRQDNAGRFLARRAGLREARGELVLLLDSRVFVHPDALRFIRAQLAASPDRRVWNGHALTADSSKIYSRFWDGVTFLAWRRYLRAPRTTSYGIEEYDFYPKGTTLFLAPRQWLLDACESFDTSYRDLSLANDDTLLIRPLAARSRINISPSFSCTYHPRTSLRQFVRHTFHRGTVFVDGYYRPGSRYLAPLRVCLVSAPLAAYLALRHPRATAATVAVSSTGLTLAARARGVPQREARAMGLLAPLFALFYGAGVVRGFALRTIARRGTGSSR